MKHVYILWMINPAHVAFVHTVFSNKAEADKGKKAMESKTGIIYDFKVTEVRVWESVEQVKAEDRL